MLRSILNTALRSRTTTGTRRGYGGGYAGGTRRSAGGGRNALMSAGLGMLASRMRRR